MCTPQPVRLPARFKRFVLLLAATKGGTGKSTLSIHLAVAAHLGGLRTVIFDTDIEDDQQSCLFWFEQRNREGPLVRKVAMSRMNDALAWAEREKYQLIIIDTPGRDLAGMKAMLDRADFMLTPSQPSPLDLKATAPIRRLWSVSQTPGAIALNCVLRETLPRTRYYIERYAELGMVLPAIVGRRVQYVDAIERGLGVSEYRPGDFGDREMQHLLRSVFAEADKRKVA